MFQGEVRISKVEYDPKYGDHPKWHHVNCFAEKKNEYLFLAGGEDLPGFKSLKKEDQTIVKDTVKYVRHILMYFNIILL